MKSNNRWFARRKTRGSMLILIVAITLGLIIAICLFMMSYVRLMGSHTEQKTAIEAAALAAARDLSKIVIQTNDFGYVGLSDSAPNGLATSAADNYYTNVYGINTLLGTSLLDYIIADELGNADMKVLALQDFNAARAAGNALMTELQNAIQPGGTGVDKDGATIEPYLAAENAYKANQIRQTGSSTYRAGSMQLELGGIPGGLATNIETPRGWSSSFPASVTTNGYYRSFQEVQHDGRTWVFAGVGSSVKLVDQKQWVPTVSGLAYQFPTIVKAHAIQDLDDTGTTRSIEATACAQPASVFDPRPNPGALVISYPDGVPDGSCAQNEINDLYGSCMEDGDDNSDMWKSIGGDYPIDTTSTVVDDTASWPLPSDIGKQASNACKVAIYDWIRTAGTKASVSAVVNIHSDPFNAASPATVMWPPGSASAKAIPNGIAHIYRFNPNGTINYQSQSGVTPVKYYIVAENQTFFSSFEPLTNGAAGTIVFDPINLGPPMNDPDGRVTFTTMYDMHIRDYARKLGKLTGGKHAGTPMDDDLIVRLKAPQILALNSNKGSGVCQSIKDGGIGAKTRGEGGGGGSGALPLFMPQEDFAYQWDGTAMQVLRDPIAYKFYSPGSGVRNSYHDEGTVVEIRFRRQIQVEDMQMVSTPVTDPVTGTPVLDPVTGVPQTTDVNTSMASDIGYVGLK